MVSITLVKFQWFNPSRARTMLKFYSKIHLYVHDHGIRVTVSLFPVLDRFLVSPNDIRPVFLRHDRLSLWHISDSAKDYVKTSFLANILPMYLTYFIPLCQIQPPPNLTHHIPSVDNVLHPLRSVNSSKCRRG